FLDSSNHHYLFYSSSDRQVLKLEVMDKLEKLFLYKPIKEILANLNNYSLEDILKLGKKKLKGVSEELKEKLVELAKQKNEEIRKQKEKEFVDEIRKKFNIDEEGKSNQKKEKEE
ncbi:14318_t:CDS:2, partial [Entrophospora sp. SA101]